MIVCLGFYKTNLYTSPKIYQINTNVRLILEDCEHVCAEMMDQRYKQVLINSRRQLSWQSGGLQKVQNERHPQVAGSNPARRSSFNTDTHRVRCNRFLAFISKAPPYSSLYRINSSNRQQDWPIIPIITLYTAHLNRISASGRAKSSQLSWQRARPSARLV